VTTAAARLFERIADIAAQGWDALANPPGQPRNPFVCHAFLHALEASHSVGARTGWTPTHLIVEENGRTIAAAPLYLKAHSYGEYVFDQGWAEAFQRAGGRYYPKLQLSVPFTPATGPRLLVGDGDMKLQAMLAQCLQQAAARLGVSSLHMTFVEKDIWERLPALGFLQRTDQQFHWRNRSYRDFDDFLSSLTSIKRKNLRRERGEAVKEGIEIERLTGSDLRESHWDAFFEFYMDTGGRKWGQPYLTREFFSRVGETMSDDILLIMAKRNGRAIAGALNFIGSDALYGRNWGAIEHHPFLHFELCYYQAIDFAIERGLSRVEAGAQGAHKLARGYEPVETYSLHWIADPGLRRAVDRYLQDERAAVSDEIAALSEHTPFRKQDGM
jgi:predicted N-acyltransferase